MKARSNRAFLFLLFMIAHTQGELHGEAIPWPSRYHTTSFKYSSSKHVTKQKNRRLKGETLIT